MCPSHSLIQSPFNRGAESQISVVSFSVESDLVFGLILFRPKTKVQNIDEKDPIIFTAAAFRMQRRLVEDLLQTQFSGFNPGDHELGAFLDAGSVDPDVSGSLGDEPAALPRGQSLKLERSQLRVEDTIHLHLFPTCFSWPV